MISAIRHYFTDLTGAIEEGWNQFWFIPTGSLSLAWMRLFLGCIALYTLAIYGLDLQRLFGPDGMLPTAAMHPLYGESWTYLEYVTSSQLEVVHWLGLLLVGFFALGVGIRWTAVGACLVMHSYFNRAPVLTGQAEALLSMLLVYLCVGRSGEKLSVHRLWSSRRDASTASGLPTISNNVALRLIQIHTAIICLMMGISQLTVDVWWSGEAVWLLGTRAEGPRIDFYWLFDHPRWMGLWSHTITVYLLVFPVLIWRPMVRPLLIAVGILVWISLALVSGQVMLSLTMLVAMLAYIPLGTSGDLSSGKPS